MTAQAKQYGMDISFDPANEVLVSQGSQWDLEAMGRFIAMQESGKPCPKYPTKTFSNMLPVQRPATYLGMVSAVDPFGATIEKRPLLTMEGLKSLEQELEESPTIPRVIYIMPTYGNPTSDVMELKVRKELIRIAQKFGILLFEDDPYYELRYEGDRIPTLAELDKLNIRNGVYTEPIVIRSSSFSKILVPGLRLAWLTGPKDILDIFASYIEQGIGSPAVLNQILIAELIKPRPREYFRGRVPESIYNTITQDTISIVDYQINYVLIPAYRAKAQLMDKALKENFSPEKMREIEWVYPEGAEEKLTVSWTHPTGGLFIYAAFPPDIDTEWLLNVLLRELDRVGIHGVNGTRVADVPGRPFLSDVKYEARLNFSKPPKEQIERGIAVLAETVRKSLAFLYFVKHPEEIKTAPIERFEFAFSQFMDQIKDPAMLGMVVDRLLDLEEGRGDALLLEALICGLTQYKTNPALLTNLLNSLNSSLLPEKDPDGKHKKVIGRLFDTLRTKRPDLHSQLMPIVEKLGLTQSMVATAISGLSAAQQPAAPTTEKSREELLKALPDFEIMRSITPGETEHISGQLDTEGYEFYAIQNLDVTSVGQRLKDTKMGRKYILTPGKLAIIALGNEDRLYSLGFAACSGLIFMGKKDGRNITVVTHIRKSQKDKIEAIVDKVNRLNLKDLKIALVAPKDQMQDLLSALNKLGFVTEDVYTHPFDPQEKRDLLVANDGFLLANPEDTADFDIMLWMNLKKVGMIPATVLGGPLVTFGQEYSHFSLGKLKDMIERLQGATLTNKQRDI
ncbi:MAG: PLP-dependent aminotransferase family protein, partial [Candidatus Omnitrophica bacterium]|nr:PLP-dependent aminotransferase family protein [Candidatus Omnitrophota bacterium]